MPIKKKIGLYPLSSDNFVENLWGGYWLPSFKGQETSNSRRIGESWEFSGLPSHPSRVMAEGGNPQELARLIKSNPSLFLGPAVVKRWGNDIPLLIKFIDAERALSLQVHPPDAYAKKNEHQWGKSESWYVLDASSLPNEGIIYLGFKKGRLGLKRSFEKALDQKDKDKILSHLNCIRVHPGEAYRVVPGTLHLIGAGVKLFEIQQASDVTYRVWDWNRPAQEKRKLHLEKAAEVINFKGESVVDLRYEPKTMGRDQEKGVLVERIIQDPQKIFSVNRFTFTRLGGQIESRVDHQFHVVTCIEGSFVVSVGTHQKNLTQGNSLFVSASVPCYQLKSQKNRSVLLQSVPG